jgi:hypothetical protein
VCAGAGAGVSGDSVAAMGAAALRPSSIGAGARGKRGSTAAPLRVQTSGVGGGEDLIIEYDELLRQPNVGSLKASLRSKRAAWADLEIRLHIRGAAVADDQPIDLQWSSAPVGTVIATALRKKPSPLSQPPTEGAPTAAPGAAGSRSAAFAAARSSTAALLGDRPPIGVSGVGGGRSKGISNGNKGGGGGGGGNSGGGRGDGRGAIPDRPTLDRPKGPARRSPPRLRVGGGEGEAGVGGASLASRMARNRQQRSLQRAEERALASERGAGGPPPPTAAAAAAPSTSSAACVSLASKDSITFI